MFNQNLVNSIFTIGPAGNLFLNRKIEPQIKNLYRRIDEILGENVSVKVWPYRHGSCTFVAFDAKGGNGEFSMTIIESGKTLIPPIKIDASSNIEYECETIDSVDSFYFISGLLEGLRLKARSHQAVLLDPRQ